MSRIRSTHPELATDEAFMTMTLPAKAAWQLLWTQCDDHGVFEWKPVVLKARILPADNVDFSAIMDEYAQLGVVKKFEHDGRVYGVVRNFGRFQKPKHPSYRLPLPVGLTTFAGFKAEDSGNPPPTAIDDFGNTPPSNSEDSGNLPPLLPHSTRKSSATGIGVEEEKKERTPSGDVAVRTEEISANSPSPTLEARTYALGKQVLGKSSGGVITKLRRLCRGDLTEVTRLLHQAEQKADPMEWVSAVLRGDANAEAERREAEIYAGLQ